MKRKKSKLVTIYKEVWDFCREEDFKGIANKLTDMDLTDMVVSEMIAYLTAAMPMAHKLEVMGSFYCRVEAEIRRQGKWKEGLLSGLEPNDENIKSIQIAHNMLTAITLSQSYDYFNKKVSDGE